MQSTSPGDDTVGARPSLSPLSLSSLPGFDSQEDSEQPEEMEGFLVTVMPGWTLPWDPASLAQLSHTTTRS